MSSSSNNTRPASTYGISRRVNVLGLGAGGTSDETVDRSQAERYIGMGYRVTDRHGVDLHVEVQTDGSRNIVTRGADPLGSHYDAERRKTMARAEQRPDGRPVGLPERPLTDYEAGRKHPKDCGLLCCDHPVHFGGDEYGNLKFASPKTSPKSTRDDLRDKKRDDGGDGGAGGTAATT